MNESEAEELWAMLVDAYNEAPVFKMLYDCRANEEMWELSVWLDEVDAGSFRRMEDFEE